MTIAFMTLIILYET